MAPPKHTLARSQHGNDLRLWMHQPTPRKAKKKQSVTKQKDNPPRTNQALPNHPIQIGIPDLGSEMQKGHTRESAL